ncbi:MAG TPA: hypothetical protein VH370_26635, partial [Humisphaera sp.]|nr:hypothetical protein [Humisphaera sp.]
GKTFHEADDQAGKLTEIHGQRESAKNSPMLPASPDELSRLVDPSDTKADLNLRVRSYLHANCAICHIEAGGGNALIDLEFTTPTDQMRVIGAPPQHESFGIADAKLIAPASAEHSVLFHRMSTRGRGQMPPLASARVDEQALAMLREWINSAPPARRAENR